MSGWGEFWGKYEVLRLKIGLFPFLAGCVWVISSVSSLA